MSLYTDLVETGAQVESHESDLFTPDTPAARALCLLYGVGFSSFVCKRDGGFWLDIPGQYDPYWDNRQNRGPI